VESPTGSKTKALIESPKETKKQEPPTLSPEQDQATKPQAKPKTRRKVKSVKPKKVKRSRKRKPTKKRRTKKKSAIKDPFAM
jgi:hypothetical protein